MTDEEKQNENALEAPREESNKEATRKISPRIIALFFVLLPFARPPVVSEKAKEASAIYFLPLSVAIMLDQDVLAAMIDFSKKIIHPNTINNSAVLRDIYEILESSVEFHTALGLYLIAFHTAVLLMHQEVREVIFSNVRKSLDAGKEYLIAPPSRQEEMASALTKQIEEKNKQHKSEALTLKQKLKNFFTGK